MNKELPFYEDIPLPEEKKKKIAICVKELLKDQEKNFSDIKSIKDQLDAWKVIEVMEINNSLGRLISAIAFFKTINMDKKNTIKLYVDSYDLIMNNDITRFLPKQRPILQHFYNHNNNNCTLL